MSDGVIAELILQVIAAVAVGWVVGDWVLQRFFLRSFPELSEYFGLPERALIGLAGLFGFAIAAMVVNLVTGGAVFGLPGIVTLAGAVVVLLGAHRRTWPRQVPWKPLLLFAVVLVAIYMRPVIAGGSGARLGDPQWHLGWTEQLLHGEAIPTGPAPEFARNAYPWGYHALLATIVRLVPGSSTLVALDTTHVLFLMGLPLAAATLARRLRPDAGWFAAVAVSLIGGFGWISSHGAAFAATPSQAHHGADLVVASPNAVYELFPPALPREVGLITLAVAAWLAVLAAGSATRVGADGTRPGGATLRLAVAAGIAAGITGLISVPLFVTVLVWLIAAAIVAPHGSKLRLLLAFIAAAIGVFALWAGPVAADYFRFGGFTNVTPHVGTEWPLGQGLASWGLLGPAAALGVVLMWLRRNSGSRTLLAFAAASAVLMAVALARPVLHWHLAGNRTLLYQGRVWPPAHLLGAALAGAAIAAGFWWVRERARLLAPVLAVALTLVGAASPALASVRLSRLLRTHDEGFIFGSPNYSADGFVRQAASHLGPSDVVLVHGSTILGLAMFSFSGARLATYEDPTLSHNDLRIRFPDLAAKWDRQMALGGFRPDFTVARADEVGPARVVARGLYQGGEYVLVKDR
ncbi:MAG TPA: hypothetical protein VHV50_08550 [Actinomycetota bacterium]|jgi:hypothetical protein|nr:hypothetical protein [Actinomycetota bacterium]